MLRGTFKEIVLQVLNIGLGIGAILVMARGFYINDGLAGLGLALFMTSAICFVGFRFEAGLQPPSIQRADRGGIYGCRLSAFKPDRATQIGPIRRNARSLKNEGLVPSIRCP